MGTERNKQIDPRNDAPGRVAVDSRGRNVWQWNGDQLDSTTIMLQSLENSSLALEPTLNLRRPDGPDGSASKAPKSRTRGQSIAEQSGELRIEQTVSFKVGGGFDPYNRS
jgi:hypothetical protein